MQQFRCPSCGKFLQGEESAAARESRCPACNAVFRPVQVMTGEQTAAPRPRPVLAPEEHIQDLFLRPPRGQEAPAASRRRTWLLLSVLSFPWCVLSFLCATGSLLDFVVGVLQKEPGSLIGMSLLLAFAASFFSLWMCSNTRRTVPRDDADAAENTYDD